MNRLQKEQQISYLKNVVNEAPSLVFIDFSGVNVEEVTKIRDEFRAANCEYKVIKNTLLSKVVKDTKAEVVDKLLSGPIAIAFSREEPSVAARIALKQAKDFKNFKIRGGYMEGNLLDEDGVKSLSRLPSKDELRGMLLATMLAVPQGMMRLMLAAPQRMLMVLDAKKRQMEE